MKTITKLIAFSVLTSSALMADFARIEMGAGTWMSESTGALSYTNAGGTASDTSAEEKFTKPYVWALVKHPLPIIPNLRVEYVGLESQGNAQGTFKSFTTPNSKTSLEMNQVDLIPYYNILDNTFWLTLDLGLDIKAIDLSYQVDSITPAVVGGSTSYTESATIALPLAYVRARFEIPFSNIGFEADAKYVKYDGSTIYDARAKVDYTLDITPLIQPALEVGYRVQKYDLNDDGFDALMDLEFSGVYAGLMLRF